MTWEPSQPVTTAQDEAEWHARQHRERIEGQRWRREHVYRRIDYIPSREALEAIERRTGYGSITATLDALVLAGDEAMGDVPE